MKKMILAALAGLALAHSAHAVEVKAGHLDKAQIEQLREGDKAKAASWLANAANGQVAEHATKGMVDADKFATEALLATGKVTKEQLAKILRTGHADVDAAVAKSMHGYQGLLLQAEGSRTKAEEAMVRVIRDIAPTSAKWADAGRNKLVAVLEAFGKASKTEGTDVAAEESLKGLDPDKIKDCKE